jgi:hypothetical protein
VKGIGMPQSDFDETKASARLPHLDIAIVHRRARDGGAEQLAISLQATPSFEAFAQFLDAANPFRIWLDLVRMMWLPWAGGLPGLVTAPRDKPARDG